VSFTARINVAARLCSQTANITLNVRTLSSSFITPKGST